MNNRIKNIGKGSIIWLRNHNIGRIITVLVAIGLLIYTAINIGIARSALEATTRPYLSVESVIEKDIGDENVSVLIGVTNLGQLTATGVEVTGILIDKEQWIGTEYIETPTKTYTTVDNVTITVSGIVMTSESPPERRDFPSSIIFYPRKLNTFVMTVSRDKWEKSVNIGSVIELELKYSWGKNDYWYIATSMLDNDEEWKINLERGN